MPGRKKQDAEFRFYEVPHGERLLVRSWQNQARENRTESRKLHFHNLFEIGYCVAGEGVLVLGQDTIPYHAGGIIIIPPNYPHNIESSDGGSSWDVLMFNTECLLGEFYPDNPLFTKKILEKINRKECYYQDGRSGGLSDLVCMISEEYKSRRSYSGEYIRGLLLAVLMSVARDDVQAGAVRENEWQTGKVGQITAALEYIRMNYMEHIKMGTLAAVCNLSETHFRRLFAECMRMTPLEYIHMVRVRQACDLIGKTRYSMEEVASRVGYAAISTFNRNFRKIIGTSPYHYKKNSENYKKKV